MMTAVKLFESHEVRARRTRETCLAISNADE
jgi:hypothetical protein